MAQAADMDVVVFVLLLFWRRWGAILRTINPGAGISGSVEKVEIKSKIELVTRS